MQTGSVRKEEAASTRRVQPTCLQLRRLKKSWHCGSYQRFFLTRSRRNARTILWWSYLANMPVPFLDLTALPGVARALGSLRAFPSCLRFCSRFRWLVAEHTSPAEAGCAQSVPVIARSLTIEKIHPPGVASPLSLRPPTPPAPPCHPRHPE